MAMGHVLVDAMKERTWGVSDSDQMSKGNFVQKFECLVCTRVAKNMEMTQIGFGKMSYQANEDHYGCPSPGTSWPIPSLHKWIQIVNKQLICYKNINQQLSFQKCKTIFFLQKYK